MSLQLVKRVKAAITAFKNPKLLESHKFTLCYTESKFNPKGQDKLYLHSSAFKAGDELLVQNILLRVVDCETVIRVEKLKG